MHDLDAASPLQSAEKRAQAGLRSKVQSRIRRAA